MYIIFIPHIKISGANYKPAILLLIIVNVVNRLCVRLANYVSTSHITSRLQGFFPTIYYSAVYN